MKTQALEEHQKHVIREHVVTTLPNGQPHEFSHNQITWCGAVPEELSWLFQDKDHALMSVKNGSRLEPCPACAEAIKNG